VRDPLAKALKLYTGGGASVFPQQNADKVLAKFGLEIAQRVDLLVTELGMLQPDWTLHHSLAAATDWATAEMKSRHPDLHQEALKALGWSFSFWWK
jgi:hypothetical protein